MNNRKYCPRCKARRKFNGNLCAICGWQFVAYNPPFCLDNPDEDKIENSRGPKSVMNKVG